MDKFLWKPMLHYFRILVRKIVFRKKYWQVEFFWLEQNILVNPRQFGSAKVHLNAEWINFGAIFTNTQKNHSKLKLWKGVI